VQRKSRHQKLLLVTLYHHPEFQVNRSTTRIFIDILRFFWIWNHRFGDASGAAEVRDRPMVSLAKMMLMASTL
jgi:hypothetical protein